MRREGEEREREKRREFSLLGGEKGKSGRQAREEESAGMARATERERARGWKKEGELSGGGGKSGAASGAGGCNAG